MCASYLKTARVNMTVRQVLAVGQDFPLEPMEENKETSPQKVPAIWMKTIAKSNERG